MGTNPTFIGRDTQNQPEITSLTAFTAYKVLAISSYEDSQYLIYGPHYTNIKSKPNDTAVCGARERAIDHNMERCSCGYYGYDNVAKAQSHYDSVEDYLQSGFALATVKMSGEVIVAEKGYRGKNQRVLSLDYNGCYKCQAMPDTFVSHVQGFYAPVCFACVEAWQKRAVKPSSHRRNTKEVGLDLISKKDMEAKMSSEGYAPMTIVFHPFVPLKGSKTSRSTTH